MMTRGMCCKDFYRLVDFFLWNKLLPSNVISDRWSNNFSSVLPETDLFQGFLNRFCYHITMCRQSNLTDKLHLECFWWLCANNDFHLRWAEHLFYLAVEVTSYWDLLLNSEFFQWVLLHAILWFFYYQFINFSFNCFLLIIAKVASFFVEMVFLRMSDILLSLRV